MNRLTQQKIEVLRDVRALIKAKNFQFICYALQFMAIKQPRLRRAAIDLQQYVRNALDPYDTLFNWANANVDMHWKDWDGVAARLQWIDWMINQLEEGQ